MIEVCLIFAGLALLTLGAEIVVRGASRMADLFRIPALVVGLTIVAFGTSAPELAVSIASSLRGQADVALGNVVGSNVFNILLILGLSAIVAPLAVDRKLARFDVPVMVFVSFAAWALGCDAGISRVEGLCLFGGLVAYTAWHLAAGWRQGSGAEKTQSTSSADATHEGLTSGKTGPSFVAIGLHSAQVALGLCCLVWGARWFVAGAVDVARHMGVSDLFIGLTVIAGGTSLPELATSMVAAARGERDIAIGNVVGSNIFNILGVLGLAAACSTSGMDVAPQALKLDFPVMIFVAIVCQVVCLRGAAISRPVGLGLVSLYAGYVAILWLAGSA